MIKRYCLILFVFFLIAQANATDHEDCSLNGIRLYGKVQFVKSFADLKVKFVDSFPDLKVQFVDNFADHCGQWQKVDTFPDFKVQIVDSFEDLKIQKVQTFPGMIRN